MIETLMDPPPTLEMTGLQDIQGLILRVYRLNFGRHFYLRFDSPVQGRELVEQILPRITSVTEWDRHGDDIAPPPHHPRTRLPVHERDIAPAGRPQQHAHYTWNVGFSYAGLAALGVPQAALDTFAEEFRDGMPARAALLGDVDAGAPETWDYGADPTQIHAVLILFALQHETLEDESTWLRRTLALLPQVQIVYEQDVALLPNTEEQARHQTDPRDHFEHFGYRDAISQPAVRGDGQDPLPGQDVISTGEFIIGYADELGQVPPVPQPLALSRHGSYAVVRKLRQDVAGFRRFLRDHAAALGWDEEYLAAKLMGRWRSGAPLVLRPDHDDPELGGDEHRNNNFAYKAQDPHGLACPAGAHIRRAYDRDMEQEPIVKVARHRVLRAGIPYGPRLAPGATEDDGVERGFMFVFFGASIERQFEFVQSAWLNDGDFLYQGTDKDPIVGANDGTSNLVIPARPLRRRICAVPRFVTPRGGGYFFMPSLTGLRYLATDGASAPSIADQRLHDADVLLRKVVWPAARDSAMFGLLHSSLASRVLKNAAERLVGPRYRNGLYRIMFIGQGIASFVWLTRRMRRLPDYTLYEIPPPWSWLMRLGQAFFALVGYFAIKDVGVAKFNGVSEVAGFIAGENPPAREPEAQGPARLRDGEIDEGGPFRYSRHPANLVPPGLFLFLPRMTVKRVTLMILTTLYSWLGSWHEEYRLRKAYGDAYRRYARRTPFFLPWRLGRRKKE